MSYRQNLYLGKSVPQSYYLGFMYKSRYQRAKLFSLKWNILASGFSTSYPRVRHKQAHTLRVDHVINRNVHSKIMRSQLPRICCVPPPPVPVVKEGLAPSWTINHF